MSAIDTYGTCPFSAYVDERLDGDDGPYRAFFGMVMNLADDDGYFPRDIGEFCRRTGCAPSYVEGMFDELERRELTTKFVPDGKRRLSGRVVNFHQIQGHPDRKRYPSLHTASSYLREDGSTFDGARKQRGKDSPTNAQESAKSPPSAAKGSTKSPPTDGKQSTKTTAPNDGESAQSEQNAESVDKLRNSAKTKDAKNSPRTRQHRGEERRGEEIRGDQMPALRGPADEILHAGEQTRAPASPPPGARGATAGSSADEAPNPELTRAARAQLAALRTRVQPSVEPVSPAKPELRVIGGGKADTPDREADLDEVVTPLTAEEDAVEAQHAKATLHAKRVARGIDPDTGLRPA